MGRGRSSSCPPAAPTLFLLIICFSHCVAAARLLPLQPAAAGLVFQHGEEGNGADELTGVSELSLQMMGGGAEEPVEACAEDNDDECLQRRLLGDAHLDYIYTQHKGKP